MNTTTDIPASESAAGSTRTRRVLLNLHLYGGLATFWYFLVLGITSLAFNHPALLPEREGTPVRWDQAVTVAPVADKDRYAEALRDRLDLIGWPHPWATRGTAGDGLEFEMSRPGKHYRVRYDHAAGTAHVESEGRGLRSALHFLHGSTEGVPNSPAMSAWGWYTEFTVWYLFFAAGSGLWLWTRRGGSHGTGLVTLGVAVVASLGFIAFIVVHG